MKNKLFLAFAIAIITLLPGVKSFAQTLEEIGNNYNAARELSKTDMTTAVAKMQEVLQQCVKVGPEADELKGNITKVLPNWQYAVANNLLKEQNNLEPKDRNYNKAIAEFEKSESFGKLYNDNSIVEKAQNTLESLFSKQGIMMLQKDSADKAIAYFDRALKLNPENAKILLAKGQALRKKGDLVQMQALVEKAIEKGTAAGDTITVKNAKTVLGGSLLSQGQASFKKNAMADAVSKLNESLKYIQNKEAYYMLAVSYNKMTKFDDAISAATSGLALDEQTDLKLARYYYEIARAYEGKKDAGNACQNYKKAAFGPTAQSAKYQMTTVLKCK